jgi:thioesterase domain-containing protein
VGAEDDAEDPALSVEQLASIYLPQILAACPPGPVVLGGYSFGALVAFELARHLGAQGRPVRLLISFDGMAPGNPVRVPLPERVLLHLGELVGHGSEGRRAYLRGRLKRLERMLPMHLEVPAGVSPVARKRLRRLGAALTRARERYAPQGTVDCALLLLKAAAPEEWPGCRTDALYGWKAFVRGRIESTLVPGSHLALFSPQNDVFMAQAIGARLDALG